MSLMCFHKIESRCDARESGHFRGLVLVFRDKNLVKSDMYPFDNGVDSL
jgi:hypothetical protein